ncbi:MAG: pantetheine-phosphate adenylyltransferase [Planctomycetota bacterium]|jgi:pantetheine-phosphate adenylyltransferase
MTTALFPGTFDPVTLGHLDILERAHRLFDRVIVAVGARHDKNTIFNAGERVDLVRGSVASLANVEVAEFDGLVVEFARQKGATVLIRGIRNPMDFDYENQMALTNRRLAPEVDTVFLVADPQAAFISSSLIKEILKAGGTVAEFVPPNVVEALANRG